MTYSTLIKCSSYKTYCTKKQLNKMNYKHYFCTDKSNRPETVWQNNSERKYHENKEWTVWRPLSFIYTYEQMRQACHEVIDCLEMSDAQRKTTINNHYTFRRLLSHLIKMSFGQLNKIWWICQAPKVTLNFNLKYLSFIFIWNHCHWGH